MNSHFATVDQTLARVQKRCRWLRLLRNSSMVGVALCFLALVIEAGIMLGLVNTKAEATILGAGLLLAGFGAWMWVALKPFLSPSLRTTIAAALERDDHRFQDRLNTMLFLEKGVGRLPAMSFRERIADQAGRVLSERSPRLPVSATSSLAWSASWALMLAGLVVFNHQYAPWRRLRGQIHPAIAPSASGTELVLPPSNALAAEQPWGEVRIIHPGQDLQLGKRDAVHLSIEAAANRDLRRIAWRSSLNGGEEQDHELPSPREPRYAFCESTIHLDELALCDWDVLTYYAKAETTDQHFYASDLYFIEVRPDREDIARTPGGSGGRPFQSRNDISSLITLQQKAIRATHQFVQQPPVSEQVRDQTRLGLARIESDLGTAAQHVYADTATGLENTPIDSVLESLAQARAWLNQAAGLLKENAMDQAQSRQRAALAQLVAARKTFQEALNDQPGKFDQPQESSAAPVASSSRKLNQMAEFRDETRSAEEFLQRSLEQQKELQRQAAGPMREGSALAGQEERLGHELRAFAGEHPRPFKGAKSKTAQALDSLQRAEEHLLKSAADSVDQTRQATQDLERLQAALQNQAADEQLADVYRLKRLLDEQAHRLGQMAQPENKASAEDMVAAAGEAQAILVRLSQTLEQFSDGAGFGKPLGEAMKQRGAAEEALSRILQAQSDAERREQSAAAEPALERISNAFSASRPTSFQEAQRGDPPESDRQVTLAPGLNQSQTAEHSLKPTGRFPDSASANLDPARLPRAYRARIERYFEKLSEE